MKNGQIEEYRFVFQRPPAKPRYISDYDYLVNIYAPGANAYHETIWNNFAPFYETLHKIEPRYIKKYQEEYNVNVIEGYYCYFEENPNQLLLFKPNYMRYKDITSDYEDGFDLYLYSIDETTLKRDQTIHSINRVYADVDYGGDINDYTKGTNYIYFDVLTLFDMDNNQYKFIKPPEEVEWYNSSVFVKVKLYNLETDEYIGIGVGTGIDRFKLVFGNKIMKTHSDNIPYVASTSQCPSDFVIKDDETLVYTKNIIDEYYMIGFGQVYGKSKESRFENETSNPRRLMKFSKIIYDKDLYYKPLSHPGYTSNFGIFFFKEEDTSSSTT